MCQNSLIISINLKTFENVNKNNTGIRFCKMC